MGDVGKDATPAALLCWDDVAVIAEAISKLSSLNAPETTIARMVEPLLRELNLQADALLAELESEG
ncbi:MAG: hypothetical protein AAF721_00290 [Myxococcota bacterium]